LGEAFAGTFTQQNKITFFIDCFPVYDWRRLIGQPGGAGNDEKDDSYNCYNRSHKNIFNDVAMKNDNDRWA
jgi:hypothetical protein